MDIENEYASFSFLIENGAHSEHMLTYNGNNKSETEKNSKVSYSARKLLCKKYIFFMGTK
jgi:hypothetical protein